MTTVEYVELEEASHDRHEFINGEYAMGGTIEHAIPFDETGDLEDIRTER